jgi:4-amino-4-deoxy-L-arabinose transferase-like glycosyltransferase
MPLKPIATACVLAGITLLLYGFRLPPAPTPVEAAIVEAALAPGAQLFFQAGDDRWLMPAPVYGAAAARAIGGAAAPVRIASVTVAALSVALMFLCARQLFRADSAGLVAAILLLFTPAHLGLAAHGTGALYQLPLVLLALYYMASYLEQPRRGRLVGAGLAFAAALYTHPTAPLTMTFLVAAFAGYLAYRRRPPGDIAALTAAFLAGWLPAAIWFAANPGSYDDTFGRWVILKAHLRYPLDAVRAFVNWNTLGTRVSTYWGFFDPSWLFFDGPRAAAPLLAFFAAPLWWGLARSRTLWPDVYPLVCLGAVLAPLAGSAFGEAHAIDNAAMLLPFLILLASGGAAAATARRDLAARVTVGAVTIGVIVEYARFYF